jgi:hypothetical protein
MSERFPENELELLQMRIENLAAMLPQDDPLVFGLGLTLLLLQSWDVSRRVLSRLEALAHGGDATDVNRLRRDVDTMIARCRTVVAQTEAAVAKKLK